jgi:hypothetical protein
MLSPGHLCAWKPVLFKTVKRLLRLCPVFLPSGQNTGQDVQEAI